ncbi:Rhophilin-2-B, partial [Taenia solium]
SRLPVIPIGLKATQVIDFKTYLSPFIVSHYHDDPEKFGKALDQLTLSRSKIMEPQRSKYGLKDFRTYYDLLNTIERRFFDESIHHGFRFSWSDAFTGYQHDQRSPAFEKGSLIFNYAALSSQIAAACVRFLQSPLNAQIIRFGVNRFEAGAEFAFELVDF